MSDSYAHHQQQRESGDRNLRASDGDRDAIADLLREHHVAGRLATEEFQDRVERCYAAKTYRELDELVADLPREQPAPPVRRAWQWPALAVLPLLIAGIVLSRGHLVWVLIPFFFFFVYRPLLWGCGGRRLGWGFSGCGARRTLPPGSYV
jgi:hypothetical protein